MDLHPNGVLSRHLHPDKTHPDFGAAQRDLSQQAVSPWVFPSGVHPHGIHPRAVTSTPSALYPGGIHPAGIFPAVRSPAANRWRCCTPGFHPPAPKLRLLSGTCSGASLAPGILWESRREVIPSFIPHFNQDKLSLKPLLLFPFNQGMG